MVENIGLDKTAVFATFQRKSVPAVGIHQNELRILFLVEVAVTLHELVIILVEVFAQFFTCLMRLCLVVVELLICFRKGNIQHGTFRLLRLDCQRRESGAILANIGEKTELIVIHDHRAVMVKELNIL